MNIVKAMDWIVFWIGKLVISILALYFTCSFNCLPHTAVNLHSLVPVKSLFPHIKNIMEIM